MKSNNSTGGFTEIATVAMQALSPVSSFDGGGRNITALPNSGDFGDILKSGILGAGIGCEESMAKHSMLSKLPPTLPWNDCYYLCYNKYN
ncbi:MAG: hypothetical protein WAZ77_00440 [Candidatus Nitrosopolaris sp.]